MPSVILKPRISEKAYGLSQTKNTYVFDVSGFANKHTIAEAVKEQYGVDAELVNVANIKGKTKRTLINKRGKYAKGKRSDLKKAYVTLKEGASLPIFAAEEKEEEKAAKVADKAAKSKEKTKSPGTESEKPKKRFGRSK